MIDKPLLLLNSRFPKLFIYFETLKYLKFEQIYYRVVKRYVHPKPKNISGTASVFSGPWVPYALYEQKIFPGNHVRFLNHDALIGKQTDWNDSEKSKLWLYNLHYFEDLNSLDFKNRTETHINFIYKWIAENPPAVGNGWEPYPSSLRIVNWVKAFLSGLVPDKIILDSLAVQSDYLSQNLERHILGNHLFANAKALIFAGTFLQGKDADKWLKTGLDIYKKELDEQVLNDGGNYELTPMYHVIMLVDLLDLLNLWTAYPNKINDAVVIKTKAIISKMLTWLDAMSHNDNNISFFNDATLKIAPDTSTVLSYAAMLGLKFNKKSVNDEEGLSVFDLPNSGYISVKTTQYTLIAALTEIGPSYQPGHAHADTLSYELSLAGQRILVNSGISEYGISTERLRQRKTPAHNTVAVDGLDSSQVWSGFRVAKRAEIVNKALSNISHNNASFSASHNGFKKQGLDCIHEREWRVDTNSITVTDKLVGKFSNAIGFLHLHPSIEIVDKKDFKLVVASREYDILIEFHGAQVIIENSTWHPEFGVVVQNQKLCFQFEQNKMTTVITWQKK